MVTTQGWLFHLSDGSQLERDSDPAFAGLIGYRPPDEGLPQVPPDLPPIDDSGLDEPASTESVPVPEAPKAPTPRRTLSLLWDLHSKLVDGTTLRLSFHLRVRARVELLAKRHRKIVAATGKRVLAAGDRALLLRLDRRQWPTKLSLLTHALVALPTVPVTGEGGEGGGEGNTIALGLRGPLAASPSQWMEPGS
jgi:hypothetical protein